MSRLRRVRSVERSLGAQRRLVRPIEADQPVQLSGSAPVVWDLLAETDDAEVILDRLQSIYTDDLETIATGLRAALDMLRSANLVEESAE